MASDPPKDPPAPAEPAASTKEKAAVEDVSTPAEDSAEAAPAKEEAAPAKEEAVPAKEEAVPAKEAPAAPTAPEALDPEVAKALGRNIDLVEPVAEAAAEATDLAAAAPPPPSAPAEPVSPAKEWGAAVVLMVVFAGMCAAFLSYFRGC